MIRPYLDDSSVPPPRWYPQSDKRTPRIRLNIPAPMEPQERSCTRQLLALATLKIEPAVSLCVLLWRGGMGEIRRGRQHRSSVVDNQSQGRSVSRVLSPPFGGWRSFISTSRCRLALPPRGDSSPRDCGKRPTRRSRGRSHSYPGQVRLNSPDTRSGESVYADRLLGLAGGGVCPAGDVTTAAVRSYRPAASTTRMDSAGSTFPPKNEGGHHFTIARSRRSSQERCRAVGCVFSVALSLGLLPVVVSHHRALPCSDFPLRLAYHDAERPPDRPWN